MGGSFFIGSRFTLSSELAIVINAKNNASGALNSVSGDLDKVSKSGKEAGLSLAGIGKNLTNVGKGLTAGVTLPLLGIGAAALKASRRERADP